MKKVLLLIFFALGCAGVSFAQIQDQPLLAAKATISQNGGGAGFWQVTGNMTDESGYYDASSIQVGDVLFFTDAGFGYHLPVTAIISVSPPSFTIRVNNTGITNIVAVPTTLGALYRPSPNKTLPPYVSGLTNADQQTIINYLIEKIDNISGGTVTTSAPITGNGTVGSPLSLPNATTTAPGAMSAADKLLVHNPVTVSDGATVDLSVTGGQQITAEMQQQGAATGQTLKWDGTKWSPANDNVGSVTTNNLTGTARTTVTNGTGAILGASPVSVDVNEAGLNPTNIPITDIGGFFTNDNINAALQQLGGNNHAPVTVTDGTIIDLTLAGQNITATVISGSITTTQIENGTIGLDDLNRMGATTGQSLRWNGTAWEVFTPAAGISLPFSEIGLGSGDAIVSTPNFKYLNSNIIMENNNFRIGRGIYGLAAGGGMGTAFLANNSDQGGNWAIGDSCMFLANGTRYNLGFGQNVLKGMRGPDPGFPGTTSNFTSIFGNFGAKKVKYPVDLSGFGYGVFENVDSTRFSSGFGYGVHGNSETVIGSTSSGYSAGGKILFVENSNLSGLSARRYGISSKEDVVNGYEALGGFVLNEPPAVNSNTTAVTFGNVIDGFKAFKNVDTATYCVIVGRGSLPQATDANDLTIVGANITSGLKLQRTTALGANLAIPEGSFKEIYIANGGGGAEDVKFRNTGTRTDIRDPLRLIGYGTGARTGTPTQGIAFDADGDVLEIPLGLGSIGGSGTTNYLSKFTSSSAIGNSQLFDDGTEVHIGNTTGTGKLSVWGNTTDATAFGFDVQNAAGNNNPFYVRNDGRVGIGGTNTNKTSNLNAALNIFGTTQQVSNSGGLGSYIVAAANSSLPEGMWEFYTNSVAAPDGFGKFGFKFQGSSGNAGRQYQVYVGDLGTPKFNVAVAGAGVNVLNPEAPIHTRSNGTTNGTLAALFQNSASTDIMRLFGDGTVGIGLSSATAFLHLRAGTSTIPSMRLAPSTLTTTPTSGEFANDGSKLYFTDATNTRRPLGFETNLDLAYNTFGATASKINVDAAEGQTGGLEFESTGTNNILVDLQGTGDFSIQDAGANRFEVNDAGYSSFGSTAPNTNQRLLVNEPGTGVTTAVRASNSTARTDGGGTGFAIQYDGVDQATLISADPVGNQTNETSLNVRNGGLLKPAFTVLGDYRGEFRTNLATYADIQNLGLTTENLTGSLSYVRVGSTSATTTINLPEIVSGVAPLTGTQVRIGMELYISVNNAAAITINRIGTDDVIIRDGSAGSVTSITTTAGIVFAKKFVATGLDEWTLYQ